ncbi:glycosyltransferase family 2 protein [Marinobacteraceae bacterium S3BR75-40.1]
MSHRYTFTVFTPTYNNVDKIKRVYESLLNQSFRDFEWLIIDDGSSDGTDKLIERWRKSSEAFFPIRYVWQENNHKKVAHNNAVKLADGELFLTLDADDECVPHALQAFYDSWQSIPVEKRHEFSGAAALCRLENGDIVGDRFPGDSIDSTPQEIRYRFRIKGEKWGFQRTDVLKNFLFPEEIPGYVPESFVWDAIGVEYKTRFFNQPLRIYFQESQERKTHAIVKLKRLREPGRLARKRWTLNNELNWFFTDPLFFVKEAILASRFALHVPKEKREFVKLKGLLPTLLVAALFPVGFFMYLDDIFSARREKPTGA